MGLMGDLVVVIVSLLLLAIGLALVGLDMDDSENLED